MNKEQSQNLDIFNESSLMLLNIKDLRDIGRKFGVPSPTTLKKHELIDYILKIVYGEVLVKSRTVAGRPNSREFDMEKYLKKIEKNQILSPDEAMFSLPQEFGSFQKVSAPSSSYDCDQNIEQRVYVEDGGQYYLRKKGFIKADDDIVVDGAIISKYNLENYDVVEIILNNDNYKILTINGIKCEDKFKDFEFDGVVLSGGKKQDFKFSTKEEIYLSISKMQRFCENNDIKLHIFSSENYSSPCIATTQYDESDNYSNLYKKLIGFIAECEKSVQNGEDFVLLIDQINLVKQAINSFEKDVRDRIKKHLHDEISKILSLGNVVVLYELER